MLKEWHRRRGTLRPAPRDPAPTRSVDYAVVMSGEIDMLLSDSEVHLGAGDVLVQRGTSPRMVNRGKEKLPDRVRAD